MKKAQKSALISLFLQPGINRFTMKQLNRQLLKQVRTWASAPMHSLSAAVEGYNTPSIRGFNDQGSTRGFIDGDGHA